MQLLQKPVYTSGLLRFNLYVFSQIMNDLSVSIALRDKNSLYFGKNKLVGFLRNCFDPSRRLLIHATSVDSA